MKKIIFILTLIIGFASCTETGKKDNRLNVVTTTSMITDMVKGIGGDSINVQGLMGSGVDPHLYKASEGDVSKLYNADVVFYNGLHLEGRLVEVFEKMESQNKKTVAIADAIDKTTLITSEYFASNYDPHIWFNINYFKQLTSYVTEVLIEMDSKNKAFFEANSQAYLEELNRLEIDIKAIIETLPEEKRILVTAHDAFNYFGKEYGFNVVGLQGISTATEAGVQDVQRLSKFIIDKQVKAIFIESSVPRRTIEALEEAVKARGHEVVIGGSLYSDALGDAGTVEGTYTGMFRYNVNKIVNALK
ncbi:MAG: zinc ABC transporter substrate-binding protein [Flavobacteriaceae bacterium]|nr:zinc ABC transporter substrate-binding protein [Flavobacteriaceae bacterium]